MKKLKQYPEYYDSEVEWLRNVPSHWEVVKSKRIFVESSIKGFPNEELLAATQTKGVIPKSLYGNTTVTATKNFETLKLVEKGDFVISLRSFQGGIEYAHYRGIISPAYTILKPQEEVVHKYYRYLLKSKRYISGLTLLVTGIREGQNIDTSKFKDSYLPLPPKQEQTTIANFLDYKTEKINRFISKKKQLIELLKEQKAAIINQAVTKGLDPNVPIKDSGIEWLGEIPEHWQIWKLNRLSTKITQGPNPNYNLGIPTNQYKVLKTKDVYDHIIHYDKAHEISRETFESESKSELKDGDILIAIVGHGSIGKINVFEAQKGTRYIFSRAIGLVRLNTKSKPNLKFIKGFFNSKVGKTIFDFGTDGSTGQEIVKTSFIKKIKIPIPPIEEQQSIVYYIETETQKINKTISTIKKEITLVEEYKTALIAEAVTGKIDVRDFKLPTQETPLAMVAEEAANYNKR